MTVMVPREKWTDGRLDELNKKVDDGFARLDKKIDDGFARVDKDIRELRGEMRELSARFDARFDSLHRTLIGVGVTIVAALIGVNAF